MVSNFSYGIDLSLFLPHLLVYMYLSQFFSLSYMAPHIYQKTYALARFPNSRPLTILTKFSPLFVFFLYSIFILFFSLAKNNLLS